jgi:hypothetical protein
VQFSGSSVTDAKGGHSLQGLPPGTYIVCADTPAQPLLDPCKWEAGVAVQVNSGQTSVLNVPLQIGVFLQVRVNDPQHLLPASEKSPSDPPHLITGVFFGKGAFLAARRLASDAAGQTYQIAVPTASPLKLWLFSRHVALADDQGKPVPANGSQVPFQAAPGTNQVFAVTVTGPSAQE